MMTTVHLIVDGRAACGSGDTSGVSVSLERLTCDVCKAVALTQRNQLALDRAEITRVARAMRRFGGGFVSKLGEALELADMTNSEIIKRAWPAYWKQYSDPALSR